MRNCDIDGDLSFTIKGLFSNNNGHIKVYVFLLYKKDRMATFLFQAVNFRPVLHNNFGVVPLPSTCIDISCEFF